MKSSLAWAAFAFLLSCFHGATLAANEVASSANVHVLETVTLSFAGPETSESAAENPFTDMRLLVTFTQGDQSITVRGYYAADGNAAETGANSGNVWQCRFATDQTGTWNYKAELQSGDMLAICGDGTTGEIVPISDSTGSILVTSWPQQSGSRDFRKRGRVVSDGHHYRFSGSEKRFMKVGANSPENLLAYVDFDGTYRMAVNTRSGEAKAKKDIHRYEPHTGDWQAGDPTWRNGKGKSLIGAVNYLASTGMNTSYFLTMNIGGDGKDVWPYADPSDVTRFDCSRLDQWEILFEHMQQKGILLHVITQETENELMLDGGDTSTQRSLYYQELISRFAHHPALIWNLGEENGPANFSPKGQTTDQEKAMSNYIAEHDPYHHPVLIHSHAALKAQEHILDPLLGHASLDGVSLQVNKPERVHADVLKWRKRSMAAGRPWVISMDEIGPADRGAVPDADDPLHEEVRGVVLWGSLMAGASGVEWYFGYKAAHNDLGAEDWRSRETMWKQTRIAHDFFQQHLPYWEMNPSDEVVSAAKAYCLATPGKVYAIYRAAGQPDSELKLDLSKHEGSFRVRWLDPIHGGELKSGSVESLTGGAVRMIGMPPGNVGQDWVALVNRK